MNGKTVAGAKEKQKQKQKGYWNIGNFQVDKNSHELENVALSSCTICFDEVFDDERNRFFPCFEEGWKYLCIELSRVSTTTR